MGTATTTISGTGFTTITLQLNETTPSESDSPPPRMVNVVRKRAIAKHRIPSREGDRGQDMGSYSPTVQVQGRALAAEKAKFDTLAGMAQLDASGYGIVTVTESSAAGVLETVDKLALEDYSAAVEPGRPAGKWFNYIVNFTRFA
jgi:hypothetical protein